MPAQPDEELLRTDLEAAQVALDVARDSLTNRYLPNSTDMLLYRGAKQRFAVALRRFAALVLRGD